MDLRFSDQGITELYRRFWPSLVGMAISKFGLDEPVAEEVAQEAFYRLVTSRQAIRDYKAWLAVVLFNTCRAHLDRVAQDGKIKHALAQCPSAEDPRLAFDRQVLVSEVSGLVDARSRRMLRLHYLEGRSASEIAVLEKTTEGYVEKLIHQSLVAARRACQPRETLP